MRNGLAKAKNNSKSTSPHSSLFVWTGLFADTGFADVSAIKQLWLPEEKGPGLLYGDRDKPGQSQEHQQSLWPIQQNTICWFDSHLPSVMSQSNFVSFRGVFLLTPQLCHSLQQGQKETLHKSRISPSEALSKGFRIWPCCQHFGLRCNCLFFFNCLFPAGRITLWRVNDKMV